MRGLRWRIGGFFAASAVVAGMLVTAGPAKALPYTTGNVFVSISNGKVQERTPTGALVQTLDDGTGATTTGSAFDAGGNFFVTDFFPAGASKFDTNGSPVGAFGSGYTGNPESILFDAAGNAYVGQACSFCSPAEIRKFNSSGGFLASYLVAPEMRGSDWIDLAADQCTMFYTSEGKLVKRFDVCTNTQLLDFASGLPGSNAFALRLLPAGGALVADADRVVRLDGSGAVVQTYLLGQGTGLSPLFALNLDPNGTSFWTANAGNSNVWKVNIATGAIEQNWNAGAPGLTFGLSVKGEITVGQPDKTPPSCELTSKNASGIQVTVQDLESGLKSIEVTQSDNATTTFPPFTQGTKDPVVVTATKNNPSQSSHVSLKVTDVEGNVTLCDPVQLVLIRGLDASETVRHIDKSEGVVTITNGIPGFNRMTITVNGTTYTGRNLADNTEYNVDIGKALHGGNNAIKVKGAGAPGSNAQVMIWDGRS